MKDYCIANGIPEASIILEEKSLDTIGNGVFCAMIVHGKYLPEVIYVVSSCYHMERKREENFLKERICLGLYSNGKLVSRGAIMSVTEETWGLPVIQTMGSNQMWLLYTEWNSTITPAIFFKSLATNTLHLS